MRSQALLRSMQQHIDGGCMRGQQRMAPSHINLYAAQPGIDWNRRDWLG
jgi:hypothetical protein